MGTILWAVTIFVGACGLAAFIVFRPRPKKDAPVKTQYYYGGATNGSMAGANRPRQGIRDIPTRDLRDAPRHYYGNDDGVTPLNFDRASGGSYHNDNTAFQSNSSDDGGSSGDGGGSSD